MGEIWAAIQNTWQATISVVGTLRVTDFIDMLVVAFLIYKAIQLVRETRAELLVKGIALIILAYVLSELFHFTMLNFIMKAITNVGVIVMCIVFQPELRRALEQFGRSKISKIATFSLLGDSERDETNSRIRLAVKSVGEACDELRLMKMGALMVFEKETKLGDIVNTGTVVDADPSRMLICNLFFNKAPLHDGAVIFREGKVLAAGCILPLSNNGRISLDLGTRHRAALGMSEQSDAVVVVVSEETGAFSIAKNGVLNRGVTKETLIMTLEKELLADEREDKKAAKGKVKNDEVQK